MKPAPFNYICARSLDEAITHLSQAGDEGLILAGGQTLVPMLAMRLARPSVVIDINRIDSLFGIAQTDEGLQINTCTRQNHALKFLIESDEASLLAKALPYVGHHQTRNRGTVGGSLAHGDPASELPLIAVALDAEMTLRSPTQTRKVVASEFYTGPMTTSRQFDECLTKVVFPAWDPREKVGCGFQEVSQRHGDYAIVAAAAQVLLNSSGVCKRVAISVGGASGVPVRLRAAEEILTSNVVTTELIGDALGDMASALDPATDQQASAAYRRRVSRVLVERVILEAINAAGGNL
jgi:CO/xanthine dehydrogenase FAD-binding subunit